VCKLIVVDGTIVTPHHVGIGIDRRVGARVADQLVGVGVRRLVRRRRRAAALVDRKLSQIGIYTRHTTHEHERFCEISAAWWRAIFFLQMSSDGSESGSSTHERNRTSWFGSW
jgi:hypothetical protein